MYCILFFTIFISKSLSAEEAYFEITKTDNHETFIIKLTDPAKIDHARQIIAGATQENQNISGKIIQTRAPYNPKWSYYLEPSSIRFTEISIEQCSSTAADMEERVTTTGETGVIKDIWCPYPSKPTREIVKSD